MYLVRVASVDETAVHGHAWGTTSKNHLTAEHRPVMILDSMDEPMTRPCKNQQCRPWTWKILVSTVDDLLVLKQAFMLPSGKIDTKMKRCLHDLLPTFSFRKFIF
jgi:hypothetical protein